MALVRIPDIVSRPAPVRSRAARSARAAGAAGVSSRSAPHAMPPSASAVALVRIPDRTASPWAEIAAISWPSVPSVSPPSSR